MKKTLALLALCSLTLAACGVPSFEATEAQREADLEWVFSTFDRNYAPLEWKQKNLGVNFDDVKKDCFAKNKLIKTNVNDEFRALVYECVSKFQDAHTGAQQLGDILPGKANVAFLGFMTKRKTKQVKEKVIDSSGNEVEVTKTLEQLVVKDFLPTTNEMDFLLKKGDVITAIDGQPVKDYLLKELAPYSNLGNEDSNLTLAAAVFALRNSMETPVPAASDVKLTVQRATDTFDLVLPWNKADLFQFAKEQDQAKAEKEKKKAQAGNNTEPTETPKSNRVFKVPSLLDLLIAELQTFAKTGEVALNHIQFMLKNTFRVMTLDEKDAAIRFVGSLLAEDDAAKMPERIFPGPSQEIKNDSFQAAALRYNNKTYLYVRVESFSIGDVEVANFGKLLVHYNAFGYDGLILDLLDNGGGSLVHGFKMANMLSEKPVKLSGIQVMLNDNWVDSFKSAELFSSSDSYKTWAGRIAKILDEDRAKNLRLSRVIPGDVIDPSLATPKLSSCATSEEPTKVCLKNGTKMVLLVNEMCASMCDIFASVFKDNNFGKILGRQTMGAGGNVVMHVASPVSRIMLRQTESLIVDANGNYLENKGVVPDVTLESVNERGLGYTTTIEKALSSF